MDVSFDSDFARCDLDVATQEEIFEELARPLVAAGRVKGDYASFVQSRELRFPTGLPLGEMGMAIPHTDPEHVVAPAISVATLCNPVEFHVMGSPDETVPVSVVFMLALDDGHAHIAFLQRVVRFAQDKALMSQLINATTDDDLYQLVTGSLLGDR